MVVAELGIALALYRFVISGIEDYNKAAGLFKRYKAANDTTGEVLSILRTELRIFSNILELLLDKLPSTSGG